MKKVLYLFGQLKDKDIEWMIRTGRKERLQPGQAIIQEGVPTSALYFVLEGSLGIYLRATGNKAIDEAGTGEMVGEMSFVDARPPSATVAAVAAATVLAIPRTQMQARLDQDRDFAARFYLAVAMFLSDRLRQRSNLMGFGKGQDKPQQDDPDELDPNVLDNVHMAGTRFQEVLQRLMKG